MTPLLYTTEEGGNWISWDFGDIADEILDAVTWRSANAEINGVRVHSLHMRNGREWDTINGWRKPPWSA